jgi:hypothetical protein
VSIDAVMATASAQVDVSLNFDTFHDQLASYGDWVYSDRWGEVWIPQNVPDDFHPYGTAGHWAYTNDYGWTWASDYEWGDIPFHYGRWVNDPDDGWVWIPGYVWSPGWVVWRSNGQYTGWMPMPPDDAFLSGDVSVGGVGASINFGDTGGYYGYGRWYGGGYDENAFAANWVFVGTGHLADVDYVRFVAPRANYVTFIHSTTNITNYTIVNNFVVNRSVDVHVVERASGHPIVAVAATAVLKKPQFIMHADTGRQVQMQMRQQMPRGTGFAGSAPKPSPKMVQSLSTNVTLHNGKQPQHLFTRETVTKAPLADHPAATAPSGGMTGPRKTDDRKMDNTHATPPTPGTPATVPPHGATPDHMRAAPNNATPPTDEMKSGEHHPADVTPPPTPPSDEMRSDHDKKVPPTGTTPPGDETRRGEHRPADVTPPPTPPSDEMRTDHAKRTPPTDMTPPPDRHDRVAPTTPPADNGAPPPKPRVQHETPPPASPDDQKKDKDKKPKPGETPPPQ